jgi:hypothetical protein
MTRKSFWLVATLPLALAACGGGGGSSGVASGISSTPLPPPLPPTVTNGNFISTAATTQQFATYGTARSGGPNYPVIDDGALQVRYDAAQQIYEVRMPGENWARITVDPSVTTNGSPRSAWLIAPPPGGRLNNEVDPNHPLADHRYVASNLAFWIGVGLAGNTAFGIPTAASAIPLSGSANYSGLLSGRTNETWTWEETYPGFVNGSIDLAFDFGAGTLSGAINPQISASTDFSKPMAFTDTVFGAGSTSFSGRFDTNVVGPNGFSGQFTGSAAQELIGSFRFPYVSPADGKQYDAAGAFVAKK